MISISSAGSTRPETCATPIAGEAADDMDDGIGFAKVREKPVPQAFAPGSAGDEAGDIDEFDHRRHRTPGPRDLADPLEFRVGDADHAHVGVQGAERIVFGGNLHGGERVEQCRFTDIRQADDTALNSHSS